MSSIFNNIRAKIGLIVTSVLSALGAGGSATTAVCQTACSTGSTLPFFLGFTLSATPLAFIEDYQRPLWWVSFVIFGALAILFMKKTVHAKTDRPFLFLNAGLLMIGFPYFRNELIVMYWIGLAVTIFGLYQLITSKFIIQWK